MGHAARHEALALAAAALGSLVAVGGIVVCRRDKEMVGRRRTRNMVEFALVIAFRPQ